MDRKEEVEKAVRTERTTRIVFISIIAFIVLMVVIFLLPSREITIPQSEESSRSDSISSSNVADGNSASNKNANVESTATPKPTPTPTPARDMSFMDGTWRDEVYREGNSWVQFEVVINTKAGTVSINSITENARTVMSRDMEITEYGEDYISAGGYVFTYLEGDLLDVNSALFTNPPLTRYSENTVNDAFGADESDYRKTAPSSSSSSAYLSEDVKATLWALAEKAVKNELKAPSTAKFPASYGSDGVSFGKSGDLYYVTAYVDAENGFGATLRTGFTVYAKLDGTKMVLDHVDLDE